MVFPPPGVPSPYSSADNFYGPWQSFSWRPENVQKETLTLAGDKFAFNVIPGRSFVIGVDGSKDTDTKVFVTWGETDDPTDQDYDDFGLPFLIVNRGGGVLRAPPGFTKFGLRVEKAGTWDIWIVLLE